MPNASKQVNRVTRHDYLTMILWVQEEGDVFADKSIPEISDIISKGTGLECNISTAREIMGRMNFAYKAKRTDESGLRTQRQEIDFLKQRVAKLEKLAHYHHEISDLIDEGGGL